MHTWRHKGTFGNTFRHIDTLGDPELYWRHKGKRGIMGQTWRQVGAQWPTGETGEYTVTRDALGDMGHTGVHWRHNRTLGAMVIQG